MLLENFAQHWCSKMQDKESLFAKCHTTVNPESYYKVQSETFADYWKIFLTF